MKSFLAAASLLAVARAYTQPVQPPSYGALLTPSTSDPVTTGQDFTITWDPLTPDDGVTVSLVLCNGPSTNCVLQSSAIVEKVPASQASYTWSVPCSLPAGVASTSTGYGMLIIVDGTGQFQYSTQFSVNTGSSCSSSSTTTTTTTSSSSTSTSSSSSSSSSSSTSVSYTTTASISASPSPSAISGGWYGWTSTGFNTTTVPAQTGSSAWATGTAGTVYTPSGTTSSAVQAFTGAAAVPTAFVNAAGMVGAAALAMLAL